MNAVGQLGQLQFCELWEPAKAYDFAASGYDSWRWQKVWREVERDLVQTAVRTQGFAPRVLDIGCGTGTLLRNIHKALAGAELVGVDISRGMLQRASEKLAGEPVELIHDDFLNANFQDKSFDVVFMCRVASHIADLKSCFQKIASLIREGGIFAFSDVYSRYPYHCTRLPFSGGKIPVATCKHRLPEIVRAAYECSLIVTSVKACSVDGLPSDLQSDPKLPRTLVDQLESGSTVPFGCLMTFSMSI
jgi:ubiquinone/menaquinone biosynthesis C-methylase UbiE